VSYSPSGTSVQGSPIVRAFPFAYNSPGILTGYAVYTPTVNDILLEAWIEIDTAWDGTSPLGDFGPFEVGNIYGWLAFFGQGPYLCDAADSSQLDVSTTFSQGNPFTDNGSLLSISDNLTTNIARRGRAVPAKFIAANPIKVVVSQDGTNTGADPGSTVGSAILYLVTATPA
jgi:hypothetical protein